MCIAFDGAYILEAPTAVQGPADDARPAPEATAPEPDRQTESALPAPTGEHLAKVGA
jgi:hypothetical protein